MSGGRGLLWTFFSLLFFAVAVWADDTPNSKNSDTTANSSSPPKTKAMPVEESLHGHTIVDKYRWLEDSKDPEVQAWVGQELGYTRSILDLLPGRVQIEKRLEHLLTIGSIGVPQMGGKYYFYTR